MCEIIGEIKKYSSEMDAPDYLIKLSELGDDQFGLDSSCHANVGRFVNHSCEPNLVLVRALIEEYGLCYRDLHNLNLCYINYMVEFSIDC